MKRLLTQVLESCEGCPYNVDIPPYPAHCRHPEVPVELMFPEFSKCPLPEEKGELPTDRARLGLARGVMYEAIFILQEGLKKTGDTAPPTEADLVEYVCNDCDQLRRCLPHSFVCRCCLGLAGTLVETIDA